ncbi:TetR/AcrR family transcriptional regulator [Evansella halocellulosilytica]|uniref:TetR/AcrR family transcriptional regulator n=1 Tax=Evansella halocellulosilytica TaxID=2011013 RepID=UPI000BB87C86|nr:TetR/AcrR family transcriptional regulator [Evansella halocellulosilytica]
MTPLKDDQLDRIRDERREQIKQVALTFFARYGYKETKTSQIASEARISEGLIYRYFKTKKELFSTIVHDLLGEAKKELESVPHIQGTPLEQMKVLTENMLDEKNKFGFMLIHRVKKSEDIPDNMFGDDELTSEETLINVLIPTFEKGQESGEFTSGDPKKILSWYFSIIDSLIMCEIGNEEYGMPDVEMLIRMIKK